MKHVILDTDLGSDIDDHWAIGMLLNIPQVQFDLLLVTTGDTAYRANLASRFLEAVGRTDIPVGIGPAHPEQKDLTTPLREFIGDYDCKKSACKIYDDGIDEAMRIIERNDETTIIGIGPMSNLGELVTRRPELTQKCHFVAMAGSIAKNFRDNPGKINEYNVVVDTQASQKVFSADWKSITITPLDHCGGLVLRDDLYQRVLTSPKPIPQEIIRTYRAWQKTSAELYQNQDDPNMFSSILYDTAAVWLATDGSNVQFKDMNLYVDGQGYMQESPTAKLVHVALDWHDRQKYYADLVEILTR